VTGSRRRRRRRLLLVAIPLLVLVAILVVAAVILTGRLVVPSISGKLYPIKYSSVIGAVADKYNIDPYLLAAVARTESGFNPQAESGDGALGLMQLLPSTAKWVTTLDGWKGPKNPTLIDPQDSLELGACYLAYLQHTLEPPIAAIAAYNAGQGNARQWVKAAGGADSFGAGDIPFPETKEFVRRVNYWRALFEKAHPHAFQASTSGS
jgi:soluble lytic murein transglycosylase